MCPCKCLLKYLSTEKAETPWRPGIENIASYPTSSKE